MYRIFVKLLEERGMSVSEFSRATGINQSTLANWKKRNNLISGKNAKIIAEFFGVPIDYLMTGNAEERTSAEGKVYYFDDETAETAQALMEDKDLKLLFDAARDSSPDVLRLAADMLRKFKETNPNG